MKTPIFKLDKGHVIPLGFIEKIYDNPDFFISIASYLQATNKTVSIQFLKLFDMDMKDLPAFDEGWAELFLNGLFYTYRCDFEKMEKEIKALESKAHKSSIIFRKKVCISSNNEPAVNITTPMAK